MAGQATKLCFAPTSRPSTSSTVVLPATHSALRLTNDPCSTRLRTGIVLNSSSPACVRRTWMAGTSPRLSGSFFVDKVHGVDSSVFQAFGDVLDREKDQAMLHQNSVFHGLLKHVPWDRFDRLVEDHGADARVRRLSTKAQFIALLY